jgi:putative iron-regulated protein
MQMMNPLGQAAWCLALASSVLAQAPPPPVVAPINAVSVVRGYAAHCFALHRDCAAAAVALQKSVHLLLKDPSKETLHAARASWTSGRKIYCQLEAIRFYGGPIDALEPHLNAWPIDEAYIDQVAGRPDAGIIHDRETYRVLSAPLLLHANERGGETNVSVGWHAIEFLLWGQDVDPNGPGQRPYTDFVEGAAAAADRRRVYLRIVSDLLVEHLTQLRDAWAPDANNYRRTFEQDVPGAVRKMLTGALILTAFELCGERLAVAYETQDQEQEHSCFSDTTCQDLVADQLGLLAVFEGGKAAPQNATLLALVRSKDVAVADHLQQCLHKTMAALRAIPQPFDQAILGAVDSPGRSAILRAIEALEHQAEAIAIAGQLLGYELPVRPGN